MMVQGLCSAVNLWSVPDVPLEDKDEGWFKQREASVLRYKEKRQNRLFAKRIRYQVRKLNAEKRPRVKVFESNPLHYYDYIPSNSIPSSTRECEERYNDIVGKVRSERPRG